MGEHRIQKVNKEVKQLISSYISQNLASQFSVIISINVVIVSRDLRTAKIFVSFLNKDLNLKPKEENQHIEILQKHAAEIQFYISKRLRMKFNPKLTFFLDDSVQQQMSVQNLLDSL
ncbi:MAG: 30S ribosome-binding factor RbfA [Bdellovibrionaceae bacterium]|nr:30S ribosome-binding factor RbfA [Pseudobdellovibrionaceae bacterium]